jgi:hypothetical protein
MKKLLIHDAYITIKPMNRLFLTTAVFLLAGTLSCSKTDAQVPKDQAIPANATDANGYYLVKQDPTRPVPPGKPILRRPSTVCPDLVIRKTRQSTLTEAGE